MTNEVEEAVRSIEYLAAQTAWHGEATLHELGALHLQEASFEWDLLKCERKSKMEVDRVGLVG